MDAIIQRYFDEQTVLIQLQKEILATHKESVLLGKANHELLSMTYQMIHLNMELHLSRMTQKETEKTVTETERETEIQTIQTIPTEDTYTSFKYLNFALCYNQTNNYCFQDLPNNEIGGYQGLYNPVNKTVDFTAPDLSSPEKWHSKITPVIKTMKKHLTSGEMLKPTFSVGRSDTRIYTVPTKLPLSFVSTEKYTGILYDGELYSSIEPLFKILFPERKSKANGLRSLTVERNGKWVSVFSLT